MQNQTVEIHTLAVGPLQANCHILVCNASREAIIIDPGDEGERIVDFIHSHHLKPIMILNTHGHGDHIGANGYLKSIYNIPISIHAKETQMLIDAEANLSGLWGLEIISPSADNMFQEGDCIEFCRQEIKILETSGHSPGGSSFLIGNHVITGDALFKRSIGRTDLEGCSHEQLIKNIREKLLVLDDNIIVYPGHGPTTTIGEERRNNPFLQ